MTEEIEGLDSYEVEGWGEYPLDSVFVRTETRTVGEVVKRIEAGRYELDPDFQRDFVWAVDKQSRLIESCIMRIPLPVLYVAEAKDGRIIVVDGLQRLTTFTRFIGNEFALRLVHSSDVSADHPLSGLTFSELPLALRERIEDTQLTLYVLDAKAPERARLDIFERVNGGVPLTRQQMRNCLYNGAATRWLREMSQSPAFLESTGRSLDPKSMRDREAINRFCAFRLLGSESYSGGDMDTFLARALEKMTNLDEESLQQLRRAFERSLKLNFELFGEHSFRKSLATKEYSNHRSVINIALFDVCSVLFAEFEEGDIRANTAAVHEAIVGLLSHETFIHSISYSTNSTKQVQARFQMAGEALLLVLL